MSFILDQVRRIDAQLDRVQLASRPSSPPLSTSTTRETSHESKSYEDGEETPNLSARLLALQGAIRGLSPGNKLLSERQVGLYLSVLSEDGRGALSVSEEDAEERQEREPHETELEWLVVAKATTQIYGLVLKRILEQTVQLAEDVWYWDEVLGSRRWTALYGIQISPVHFWHWSQVVWADVKERSKEFKVSEAGQEARESVTTQWKEFYGLVRRVVRERSVESVQWRVLSPVTRVRAEVRRKQAALKKVRLRNANALGVLLGEGLANESVHGEALGVAEGGERWKGSVARNVALIEAVLAKANDTDTPVDKFDAAVAELTDDDPLYGAEMYDPTDVEGGPSGITPQAVADRLIRVLSLGLPQYNTAISNAVGQHGKPSRLVRYWLPVTVGLLSSSTILRILVSRQAEILQWIRELGTTVIDFWSNWVVEPTKKVIQTIRHDEGSEVSIMSKRSLEGDRESLERMVVDFAIDNPSMATGSTANLTEAEIAEIRTKVSEGDLTPVLRAYEKDLSSPLMGTLRGNLIRALLIQVQKTKVDVEVAISGIDSLLKSQELVFGFIGLTPGLLLTYFVASRLRSSLSNKSSAKSARKQGKMLRQLRNVDRILTNSQPTEFGELYYKDQGLLLCEVHVLREAAGKVMPGEVFREFGEDVAELCDVRSGVGRQREVVKRVRWAYGRWLS